jgi:hypothetical protein
MQYSGNFRHSANPMTRFRSNLLQPPCQLFDFSLSFNLLSWRRHFTGLLLTIKLQESLLRNLIAIDDIFEHLAHL